MANNCCCLCEFRDDDELKFGKFLTDEKENISAHYYCLLLSSNLIQRGNEKEGFYGFLYKDINNERHRIQNQKCKFCKNKYANIACCKKTCRTFYHLKCGYEHRVLFQFKLTFMSFCQDHYPFEEVSRPKRNDICHICKENIGKFVFVNTIKAPCCQNGWFHRWCLSEYASNAGYFFKCPLCQNEPKFRDEIASRGVFVPDKDAEWETEPNAFQDLLERPSKCSCKVCLCSKGRGYTNNGVYKFKICITCGSCAAHERCLIGKYNTYECAECRDFTNSKIGSSLEKNNMDENSNFCSNQTQISNQKTTEEEYGSHQNKRKLMDIYESSELEEQRIKHRRISVNISNVRRSSRILGISSSDGKLFSITDY